MVLLFSLALFSLCIHSCLSSRFFFVSSFMMVSCLILRSLSSFSWHAVAISSYPSPPNWLPRLRRLSFAKQELALRGGFRSVSRSPARQNWYLFCSWSILRRLSFSNACFCLSFAILTSSAFLLINVLFSFFSLLCSSFSLCFLSSLALLSLFIVLVFSLALLVLCRVLFSFHASFPFPLSWCYSVSFCVLFLLSLHTPLQFYP